MNTDTQPTPIPEPPAPRRRIRRTLALFGGAATLASVTFLTSALHYPGPSRVLPGLSWVEIKPHSNQLPSFSVMQTEATIGMMLSWLADTGRASDPWYAAHEKLNPMLPATNVTRAMIIDFSRWLEIRLRASGELGPDEIVSHVSDAQFSELSGIDSEHESGATPAQRSKRSNISTLVGGSTVWPPAPELGNFLRIGDDPKYKTAIPGPGDGYAGLAPVGSYPADSNGVRDLAGNAAEIVVGEAGNLWIRGGSFRTKAFDELRASHRKAFAAAADDIGFRLVRVRK